MTRLQPTETDYIRRIVRDELGYVTPTLAAVTDTYSHTEAGDNSNYEVDLELVGTGTEVTDGDLSLPPKTLERVPVAVTMDGATRGLEPGDLVILEFLDGDKGQPVVTHAVYGDGSDERAPLTEPGDFRRRIGQNAIIEIVTDEDGNRKLNLGRQPDDRDGIDMGLTMNLDGGGFCLMDGSEHGLFFDGDGNAILKWTSMAMPNMVDGDVNFESGGPAASAAGTSSPSTTGDQTGGDPFGPIGIVDAAAGSGMAEAESLATGMQLTSLAASQSVRGGGSVTNPRLGANPRLPTTWTQAALTAEYVPEPMTSETVDLYREGLRDGDLIDPYLDDYLRSDTAVVIPAGEYRWHGDGLSGAYRNAALLARGGLAELHQPEGTTQQATITVPGGGAGSFLLSNIAIRGESTAEGAVVRIQCTDDLASAMIDGLYLPDGGAEDAGAIGLGVSPGHEGELYVRNSVIAGFPGGGMHASAPGTPDGGAGPVFVEGGLYRANGTANVRIGAPSSTVRGVTVFAPASGPTPSHGIWVTESGDDLVIEGCDVTQAVAAPAIQMSSPQGSTVGTIERTRITNQVRTAPISVAAGHSWSGSEVHLTGEGSQELAGEAGAIETITGAAADPATTTPQRVD